jgi:tetratricopeptide (TPR) repeat protein
LADRYTLDGDKGDRDGAITWLRRVCDKLAPAENAPIVDLKLASLLIERAEERCDSAETTAAVGYAERAVAGLDGDPHAFALHVLGVGHLVQAGIGPVPSELPIAIGHLREAAALLSADNPERVNVEARLGVALATWVHGDPPADATAPLDEAIRLLSRALGEIPPDDAFLVRVRYSLATASAIRFSWYAGSEADLRMALSEFEAILDQPAVDVPLADLCHLFIAYLLVLRSVPEGMRRRSAMIDASHLGRLFADPPQQPAPDAARSALDHLDCVSGTATTDAAYASVVAWLRGCANMALGGGGLAEGATSPAVAAFEEALRLTPEDEPGAGEMRGILGLLYGAQAMREASGRPSGRSVESLVAAARQLGDEHPMLPLLHSVLGGASGLPLGGRVPSRAETTAAIELLENIIEEVPDDHPARAETLIRLGVLLIGRAFDLDRAVLHLTKLRRKLDRAIARPAVSHLNEAVNHFLVGMAEGIEGLLAPNAELVKSAVDRLKRAVGIAPVGHPGRKYIQAGLICLLCQRYSQDGEFQNLDAAIYYAGELVRALEGDEISDPLLLPVQYLLAVGPTVRSPGRLDRGQLDEMVAQLETLQARMPEDHPLRRAVAAELSTMRVMRGGLAIADGDFGAALRDSSRIADAANSAVAIARATSQEDPFYAWNLGTAGNARAMHGILIRDRRVASEGIALLAEACAAAKSFPEHRRRLLSMLACALRMRYDITRDRNDLNGMISRLEEARRLADEDQGGTDMAGIFYLCAAGYHDRNDQNLQDRRRAAAFGLSALRVRSTTVLLQSTADRAFDAALAAAGEAADVARWCLADGNTEAAVEALERGRGMVLHTAVADASVPSLLREAGHDELASEWETALAAAEKAGPDPWDLLPSMIASLRAPSGVAEEVARSPEVRLPDDLRYRVVKTLQGTELDRLLAPPPVTEIVQALRTAGARALAYLLPRDGSAVGLALVVDDAGEIREIRLPRLMAGPRGPTARFAQAQRDFHGAPPTAQDARLRWQRALDGLCDWAWTAAMDRVLDSLAAGPGHPVRLVLVPVGDLSLVPWHAARRAVAGGDFRYACQDAVISYAASARQFTEACRNRHRPWPSAAALVRVPSSRLFFASKEIHEIRLRHYAEGVLLGGRDRRSPPATAENVRGLLPRPGADGVSLLHLGCHAEPAPRPVDGRLVLEDGETLSMRDILHQTRARPRDSPGCLVVLAACGSDLSASYHDEALTLATSFLAAGAVGAVGTRWPVTDLPTLALMTMFHHYLNSGYDDPSTALRAAQGWMLNPDRSFPEGFHPKIAEIVRTIDLATPECWAAFTYQGQ